MKLFFCNKTVGKQRMGEPRAGGRKKWEQERSKMHIAHTGRQTGRRKKKKRKSMEDISQRRKLYDRKPLACKKKKILEPKRHWFMEPSYREDGLKDTQSAWHEQMCSVTSQNRKESLTGRCTMDS